MDMPAPSAGFTDLWLLMQVLGDQAEYRKRLDEYKAAYDKAVDAIKKVGKVDEIEALHDKANMRLASAETMAADIISRAEQHASGIAQAAGKTSQAADAKLAEAMVMKDESEADARKRNARCLQRERDVEESESDLAIRKAAADARDTAQDKREAEVAAREMAVTVRENKIKAMLAA